MPHMNTAELAQVFLSVLQVEVEPLVEHLINHIRIFCRIVFQMDFLLHMLDISYYHLHLAI